MSAGEAKTWLVCYDIRAQRRLRRVHRILRRRGATVQYSAFAVRAHDRALHTLLDLLRREIAVDADDLRAYHVPARCRVWALGTQDLPEGIELDAQTAAQLLLATGDQPQPHPLDLDVT